jgi:DNA-binding CsgD family transcriptional regulator
MGPRQFELTRERQDAAPRKTGKFFWITEAVPCSRAPKGASARVRSVCPLPGVLGRPCVDALIYFGDPAMKNGSDSSPNDPSDALPPLPLNAVKWRAVCAALRLSPMHARIVELTLRDACNKQISSMLGISDGTLKSHQKCISARTATRGRMQLAMRVLAVSHEIAATDDHPPNG